MKCKTNCGKLNKKIINTRKCILERYFMALLKCPECGHSISEYAAFCPNCGCTIDYIKGYYEKVEAQKVENTRLNKLLDKNKLYTKLPEKVKAFIYRVENDLTNNKIEHYLDNSVEYVGFRKDKNGRLYCYLTYSGSNLLIRFLNTKLWANESMVFDESRIEEYVIRIECELFEMPYDASDHFEEPNEEVDQEPIKSYVIKEVDSASYFSGFHRTKQYVTGGPQEHDIHGSFIYVEVPDFVPSKSKAYVFFTIEFAKECIEKIKDVCSKLEIVEINYKAH